MYYKIIFYLGYLSALALLIFLHTASTIKNYVSLILILAFYFARLMDFMTKLLSTTYFLKDLIKYLQY